MATSIPSTYEFRCSTCWQPNFANVEEAGSTVTCRSCQCEFVAPEATDARIEQAEQSLRGLENTLATMPETSDKKNKPSAKAEELSLWELEKLVRQECSVDGSLNYSSYPTASPVIRLCAFFLDAIYTVIAAVIGLGCALGAASQGWIEIPDQQQQANPNWGEMMPFLVCLFTVPLIALIIQWVLHARRGQSIGKLFCCIRIVVVSKGKHAGFWRGVVLRRWVNNLLGAIPFYGLIDILMIFTPNARCLHDYLAGTKVVEC